MQMMRAKCCKCNWTFDVASLPGTAIEVAKTAMKRSRCPLCYATGAVLAPTRALTDDEIAAKTLSQLGTASVSEATP